MTVESANKLRENLVKLASNALEQGILHEPRAFFDVVDVQPVLNLTQPGHAEVFKNGEQFPIRLTHLVAALAAETAEDPPAEQDERNIQRIGLRMSFHNQWYQNPQFLPLPAWGDIPTAAAPQVTFGTSAWRFDVPFVLSARDTLTVQVQLSSDPPDDSSRKVTVTFKGIGLLSGAQYVVSSVLDLDSTVKTNMPTIFFRNDGSEPIVLDRATANVSAPSNAVDPTGDIRVLDIQVRQVGNGTNADWFQGPIDHPLMPAVLWGMQSGRCIVHQFPGDGLIWEPGEGIEAEFQALSENIPPSRVYLALCGYITVS